MGQFWQEILKYICGATIAGLLLWLAKLLIDKAVSHRFAIEMENHKARLKAESDKEIENLKSQLQLLNQQQIIRFSGLHEKRADIIQKLYKLLTEAMLASTQLRIFSLANETMSSKIDVTPFHRQLKHSGKELRTLFADNQLFFKKFIAKPYPLQFRS